MELIEGIGYSFREWLATEEKKLSSDQERRRKLAAKTEITPPVFKPRIYTMKKKAKKT